MRNAYIVRLPMGTGKTRLVLRKLLYGAGRRLSVWNRRLEKTLIVGPNDYVHRAWRRELLLLARDQKLVSDIDEEAIRDLTLGRLGKTLSKHGISLPTYRTYRQLGRERKGRWHYLVLDEWHRTTSKILNQCELWIGRALGYRPWYIGGHNLVNDVFFVSATPVNPVLEDEESALGEPYNESDFRDRVAQAVTRACSILQGFTGQRISKRSKFFNAVASIEIRDLGAGRLRWVLPKPVKTVPMEFSIEEQKIVGDCLRDNLTWASEYALMAGLIRTLPRKRIHRLSRSRTGIRKCFGKRYATIHIVDGLGRPPAWKYLAERHPRFRRLRDILIGEGVLAPDGLTLTNKKALVFCSHHGVALGLVEICNHLFGEKAAATNVNARDVEGVTRAFNKRDKPPYILVATDVLSEGIDLHGCCKLLVQYELAWSPLRLFQRVGRLTRRKGKIGYNRDVRVAHVVIPGSVEEERVNRLLRRIDFLAEQELWPTNKAPLALIQALLGSGPSLHLAESQIATAVP